MRLLLLTCLAFFVLPVNSLMAQSRYELNTGWFCQQAAKVKHNGAVLSDPATSLANWLPATVPGTVLTTLLDNKLVPDPFFGMNNQLIPDVYHTGNAHYTYWFVKEFTERAAPGEQVWLQLRGVNYKCDVFLNGKKLNHATHVGMMLRQQYNISGVLYKNGKNRLAILVHPPDHPGNPNGGQGGDGTIARDLTTPYTAGWDWIQPVRDRNTGIWDKVTIEKTGTVNIGNPHIVTLVPGKRYPDAKQQEPAIIRMSCELTNTAAVPVQGVLQYELKGKRATKSVTIPAGATITQQLPDMRVQDPQLWWPNGYGDPFLYDTKIQFITGNTLQDSEDLRFGIRQFGYEWNAHTRSMQTMVNGQKIFIKGGNWIISDAMLRFSPERYDAEVRFHRDMNLNLIRIWGGALTERPEFYQACDKYGMLVFQDFWFSGDCNGRWLDPAKKDDQWTRRKYPDDHPLLIDMMADQIKLIRNHASLAYWCGGNEIAPPNDILHALKDSLLPALDGTRCFFDYSNSDSMSYNSIGGNGDGPYNIQDENKFFTYRTWPFNSEIGSVGTGDYASLVKFIPEANLIPPPVKGKADSVWEYHRYIPYDDHVTAYGSIKDVKDFAMKAQLVNYTQYRALIEGFTSHMWDWYTGVIIWKTQNPWTALRGQMYDYYLDVNACLYGLRTGSKPLHIMMDPSDSTVFLVNNGFRRAGDLMVEVRAVDVLTGKDSLQTLLFSEVGAGTVQNLFRIGHFLRSQKKKDGLFVLLRLRNAEKEIVDENFYWLPGEDKQFGALQQMPAAPLKVAAVNKGNGKIEVKLTNDAANTVSFFNRIALLDPRTMERLLPTFFSDNYVSIIPGETRTITVEHPQKAGEPQGLIQVYGWNMPEMTVTVSGK